MIKCNYQPDDLRYAPCTREDGHDGPCAHEFIKGDVSICEVVEYIQDLRKELEVERNAIPSGLIPPLDYIKYKDMIDRINLYNQISLLEELEDHFNGLHNRKGS